MKAIEAGLPRCSQRIIASPYARRLARERGIALERLMGTGPRGRILAADLIDGAGMVADTVLPKGPDATRSRASATPAALAGTLPLAALIDLLEQFRSSGATVKFEDAFLRATALALVAAGIAVEPDGPTIEFEQEGSFVAVTQATAKTVGVLRALRMSARMETHAQPRGVLSLRVDVASDFAPLMLPLRDGSPIRIIITPRVGSESASVLLCFDPSLVEESAASYLLKALGDLLGNPLRLFV